MYCTPVEKLSSHSSDYKLSTEIQFSGCVKVAQILRLKNKYKINTVVQDESLCSVHTYCTYVIPRGFL